MSAGSKHVEPLQLLKQYADALTALQEAGVTRTANSPVSDFAEHLVANYYNTVPLPSSGKNYDLLTPDGERVQVKALWRRQRRRTSLSVLRDLDLDPPPFDVLVAIVFATDLQSWDGYALSCADCRRLAGWSKRWGAHRLSLTAKVIDQATPIKLPLPAPEYWQRVATTRVGVAGTGVTL